MGRNRSCGGRPGVIVSRTAADVASEAAIEGIHQEQQQSQRRLGYDDRGRVRGCARHLFCIQGVSYLASGSCTAGSVTHPTEELCAPHERALTVTYARTINNNFASGRSVLIITADTGPWGSSTGQVTDGGLGVSLTSNAHVPRSPV